MSYPELSITEPTRPLRGRGEATPSQGAPGHAPKAPPGSPLSGHAGEGSTLPGAPGSQRAEEAAQADADELARLLAVVTEHASAEARAALDLLQATRERQLAERAYLQRKRMMLRLIEGVADNLDRAVADLPKEGDASGTRWHKRVRRLARQLDEVLGEEHVERIDVVSAPPGLVEISAVVDRDDVPDGTVLDTVQSGWLLDGELLRKPNVVVSRSPAELTQATEPLPSSSQGSIAPQSHTQNGETHA